MPIRVTCQCGHAIAAPDAMAGKVGKCPKCAKPIKIPAATSATPAKPTPEKAGAKETKPTAAMPSSAKPKSPKPAEASPPPLNSLDQLLSDAGLDKKAGPTCPNCGTEIPPNAAICVECGLNFATGEKLKGIEEEGGVVAEKFHDYRLNRASREIQKDEQELEKLKFAGAPWWVTLAVVLGLLLIIFFGVIIVDGMAPPGEGGDGMAVEASAPKPAAKTFVAKVQRGSIRNALIIVCFLVSSMVVIMAWIAVAIDAFQKKAKEGFLSLIPFYVHYYCWNERKRIAPTVKILYVWTVICIVFVILLFTSGSYRAFQVRSLF